MIGVSNSFIRGRPDGHGLKNFVLLLCFLSGRRNRVVDEISITSGGGVGSSVVVVASEVSIGNVVVAVVKVNDLGYGVEVTMVNGGMMIGTGRTTAGMLIWG